MKRINATLGLAALAVIAALCPAAAEEAKAYSAEERAAIMRVKEECIKAGTLTGEDVKNHTWEVDSYLFPHVRKGPLVDASGKAGIIVLMGHEDWRDCGWVVFDNDVMRLDNMSGEFTPRLPMYLIVCESAYDPADPGPDIIGDAVKLPRDAEGPYEYVTTRWSVYMHAAPSQYYRAEPFSAVAVIPGDTELPILAWTCTFVDWDHFDLASQYELWIRTEYNGMKGWVCAWEDYEALFYRTYVDLPANSMFKMKVAVDELKFMGASGPIWLEKGEELSFIFAKPGRLNTWRGDIPDEASYSFADFTYKGVPGLAALRYSKPEPNEYVKADIAAGPDWSVEIDPRFHELNCEYNYRDGNFPYVAPQSEDIPDKAATIFYVDGSWAALELYTPLGGGKPNDWFYIGTKEHPRFCIFEFVGEFGDIRYVPSGDSGYRPPRIESSFRKELWPDDDAHYVDIRLFSELYDADLYLDTIAASQPPGGNVSNKIEFDAAYPNVEPNYGDKTLTYRFTFPEGINPAEPYRLDFTLHWPEENRDLVFSYLAPGE